MVPSPKHVAPLIVIPSEYDSKINIEDDIHDCYIGYYCDVKSVGTIEDDYFMPTTEFDDHDWDNDDTTYNLETIFGTNSENGDIKNCYAIISTHVPSNDDMESFKIGDDGFENTFDIYNVMFENYFANNYNCPSAYNDNIITENEFLSSPNLEEKIERSEERRVGKEC